MKFSESYWRVNRSLAESLENECLGLGLQRKENRKLVKEQFYSEEKMREKVQ